MKILLITTNIDKPEAEMFARMNEAGHQVVAICDTDSIRYKRLQDAGVEVNQNKIRRRPDKNTVKKIKQLIAKYDFDVVHILRKHGISVFFKAIPDPKAKIVVYRGIIGNLSFFNPVSWRTFLNPKVDRIICVCEAVRQYFLGLKFPGYQFPQYKAVTIHKGHDVQWYDHTNVSIDVIEAIGDAKSIGCVARMRARKGVTYLIDAFNQIADSFNVHLFLIGEIEDNKIYKKVNESLFKERIHMTGFRNDATAISGKLDIIVLPTLRREGLPRAIIETMAQGVPAVVTDSGGSPEIVVDNESGYVVPTHDAEAIAMAMKVLLSDDEKHRQFSENARNRIKQHFNVEMTVNKTLKLYEELLAEKS